MNAPSFETLLAIGRLPVAALFGDGENPGPTGPEGERVGDSEPDDEDDDAPKKSNKDLEPIPGPGAPLVPDHATIDSNPIDPRVF